MGVWVLVGALTHPTQIKISLITVGRVSEAHPPCPPPIKKPSAEGFYCFKSG